MSKAGDFEITHWKGGYPVWCQIYYKGKEVAHGIHHSELSDLKYAIEKAIQEVRCEMNEKDRGEV